LDKKTEKKLKQLIKRAKRIKSGADKRMTGDVMEEIDKLKNLLQMFNNVVEDTNDLRNEGNVSEA
jgi:hypothetical protein